MHLGQLLRLRLRLQCKLCCDRPAGRGVPRARRLLRCAARNTTAIGLLRCGQHSEVEFCDGRFVTPSCRSCISPNLLSHPCCVPDLTAAGGDDWTNCAAVCRCDGELAAKADQVRALALNAISHLPCISHRLCMQRPTTGWHGAPLGQASQLPPLSHPRLRAVC